jgi:ribosomal protein S18 acetylase RimI-like enzyme
MISSPEAGRALESTDDAIQIGKFLVEKASKNNINDLRSVNSIVLPVVYSNNRVYDQMVEYSQFSYVAYDIGNGQREPIAGIGCRLEMMRKRAEKEEDEVYPIPLKLNIMTLSVLAPYRRMGMGRSLMNLVLGQLERFEQEECGQVQVHEIYLNVQTNNDEALTFYKSLGFTIAQTIRNYYKRIDPPDCYVVSKIRHVHKD